MRNLRAFALCAASLVAACHIPAGPAAVPPVTSAMPDSPATVTGPDAFAVPPSAKAYEGHGVETLAPAVLEKYRPRPLPDDAARRIEAMMDVRGPAAGTLSPDGKVLYFGWSITGVSQLWKVEGPRHFPEELTGGEDVTSLAAITPDGRVLVIQRDRKGEENPGLYLQSPRGGPLELVQHEHGIQTHFEAVSSDSRYVYFTSNDRKPDAYAVYRWDVAKKEKELVFDQPGLWHISDIRDDGRLLLRKETGSLTAEYSEWDPKARLLTPLLGQSESEEYDARYGAREGTLVVLTNKLGEFRRLYTFVKGALSPITEERKADVSGFDIDLRRTRIVYTTNESGYTRPHAIDAKTFKPIDLPPLPDADHVFFGPTTPDGRFTPIGVDDGRHPVTGYVIDWARRKAEAWHAPSTPEIDSTRFARAELDTYPARDGTKIPVFVRRPAVASSAEPPPVVIAFHGGPEGQARPGFSVSAQMFVDAGFLFVEPNVRGSDGYGKAWLHADDGPKRLQIITDIEDAAKWARTKFSVGAKGPKVGIYGGSYGGYSVLMGMTMFAGAYDAGVDIVGISDLRTFLRNTAPYRRILRISEYGDPEKDADALAQLSPMTYIDRTKAPLLVMQGASDPRVPAGEAIQIHDALAKRGIPCELAIFPDEGHGAQKRENRVLMLGHAVEFFRDHLR